MSFPKSKAKSDFEGSFPAMETETKSANGAPLKASSGPGRFVVQSPKQRWTAGELLAKHAAGPEAAGAAIQALKASAGPSLMRRALMLGGGGALLAGTVKAAPAIGNLVRSGGLSTSGPAPTPTLGNKVDSMVSAVAKPIDAFKRFYGTPAGQMATGGAAALGAYGLARGALSKNDDEERRSMR